MEVLGGAELTPTQTKAIARSRAFHAEIARRAALVEIKRPLVRFVPNCPYGIPKIAQERPRPLPKYVPPLIEADYWPSMWFHDLVFGAAEALLKPRYPTVETIQYAVATDFKVRRIDMLSSRRTRDIVFPRQVAMYLCKTLTIQSFPSIGRRFGNRDHTTVLHAVQKIAGLVVNDIDLAACVEKIKASLA